MNFGQYIVDNYLLIYESLGLLALLFISAHISPRIKTYTRLTILLIIIICIVHNVEFWARSEPNTCGLRFILTSIKYIFYPLIVILLLPITSPFESLKKKNKVILILLIPLFLSAILILTSYFTHWIHYYDLDADGISIYHDGPISKFPYILFFGYYLYFAIQNAFYLKRSSIKIKLIMAFIIFGALLGVILYLAFSENDNFTPIITSSLVLYFILYYIQRSMIDPLTGLLNRQAYYQDMRQLRYNITFIISIDMNNLKYYNDNFGHEKGDVALKTVSMILFNYSGAHSSVYRTGGDEFIIFYTKITEDEVKENIKNMQEQLALTEFSCAFGYAQRHQFDEIQSVVKEADRFMYRNKVKMKDELNKK